MANINDAFPSRYLKAKDLQGKETTVRIARVVLEPFGRTREPLPVVYFVGKAKGLKLNITMAQAIAQIAGTPETDAWTGVAVGLYPTSADFGTQSYPVVRVKTPKPQAVESRRA